MTGFVGGTEGKPLVETMGQTLYWEDWYETRWRQGDDAAVGVAGHGDKDGPTNRVWGEDGRLGVLYGVLSNESARSTPSAELFDAVLQRPAQVLPELEGPFALAAIDEDEGRVVLATDKVGSRPCYYANGAEFALSSELSPLVPLQEQPEVDMRAVADLLCYGAVFGEKTLLEGIDALPPATYLTYEDDTVETTRYWYPSFRSTDGTGYVDGWLDRHRTAIDDVAATIDDDLTLCLSGGIDSRVTAGALRRADCEFDTITYATGEGGNRELASQVADRLDVSISEVSRGARSGAELVEGIRKCVFAADAMASWGFVPAIPFLFNDLADVTDIVMEGGTYLGEDIYSYYTGNGVPPARTLYEKRHLLSADEVTSIVTGAVEPRRSLREVVDETRAADPGDCSVDAMRRLYAYLHMRSTIPLRSQAGTRIVSNGPFIDHVLAMPDRYRLGTVPSTDGDVPLGVSRIKLEAVRGLGQGLETVPYERTGVSPARPFWLHVLGAGAKELSSSLRPSPPSGYLERYLTDSRVQSFIDNLVDDAGTRSFFNADALDSLRDNVDSGRNMIPVAAVVGLELWLQHHVDGRCEAGVASAVSAPSSH
jgi:asparagine synthase (glutamine-hydrolysing)